LKTDDERRQFARQVWSENNPGSHYERLAYADRKFASGDVKGSQTDRGLVYIRFGPPDSVTPYEHSESWSWRSLIGVTFDKTQTGEYRIELFGGVQRRPWDIDLGPGCCGIKSAPLPEPLNEFGGGPPPKECRCEGFRRSPETQIRAKLQPGMETSMFPVTKAVTRIIILMSDKQFWFHNKPNAHDRVVQFRGRVLSPAGKEIVKFTDLWLPKSSPDTTWPLNRCERLYLSPGTYRLEIGAFDWSAASQLAQCKASLEIPEAGDHPTGRLQDGSYVCQ
jgi:GWxTD domain-containing protein